MDATTAADGLLSGLDAEQRRAVTTDSTLVAVVAGAGSGKTRVLTRRIAWRVHTGSADPRHTLVVTFTREAAGELRRRLPALGLRERVEAGTFHAVMLGLLRQHWTDRGRPIPNVASDRRRLLAEVARRHGGTGRDRPLDRVSNRTTELDDICAEVDWACARGLDPGRYLSEARATGRRPVVGSETIATVLADYEVLKRRRGVIDLDDVLRNAVDLIEHDPEMARVVGWRFRHLLVDEAQDLNPLQHRLVDLLRAGHDDLFLVGDPTQAIYGFTGADPSLLLDVSERFRGIEIIRLSTNHRSTPQVVEAGRHVIEAGGMQPTTARSSRPESVPVEIIVADDETDEAERIATRLRAVDPAEVRAGHVAVLARTHAQLAAIRERLTAAGLPVRQSAMGPGSPHRAGIEAAARQRSPTELRVWAHDLLEDLEHGERLVASETVEVATVVLDYLREQPRGDGAGFRAWVTALDPLGLRVDRGVDLLTFHAAKGREWSIVVVSGVETGLVPHRSATTNAGRAEEARLLYVALTRAHERLVITWAQRRGGYRRQRSPLLDGFSPGDPPPAVGPDAMLRRRPRVVQHPALAALRAWRERTARAAGILPEQLCADQVLRRIAEDPPTSAEQLADISGVGLLTAQRWYPGMAAALDPDGLSR